MSQFESSSINRTNFENIIYDIYCDTYDRYTDNNDNKLSVLNNVFINMNVTIPINNTTENKLYNYYCENENLFVISMIEQTFPKYNFKDWNITSFIDNLSPNILKLFAWYGLDDSMLYKCPDYVTTLHDYKLMMDVIKQIKIFNRKNILNMHPEIEQDFYNDLMIAQDNYDCDNDTDKKKKQYIEEQIITIGIKAINTIAHSRFGIGHEIIMEIVNTYEKNKLLLIQYINSFDVNVEYNISNTQMIIDETIEELLNYNNYANRNMVKRIIEDFLPYLNEKELAMMEKCPFEN